MPDSDTDSRSPTRQSTRLDANEVPNAPANRQDRSAVSSSRDEIDAFLQQVDALPQATGDARGRLIFALDATASRQGTWDRAMGLQGDMFTQTRGIGALDVQLVFYRGYGECRASPWIDRADKLVALMQKVSCVAGRTQIERILRHGIGEAKQGPVHALVFVGDCVEEPVDRLGELAGRLKLFGLPLFIFQEGHDPHASQAFAQLATLSGGAHCRFDDSSAEQLGRLLNAVAAYATGGREALQRLEQGGSGEARQLLEQLR